MYNTYKISEKEKLKKPKKLSEADLYNILINGETLNEEYVLDEERSLKEVSHEEVEVDEEVDEEDESGCTELSKEEEKKYRF